jgi:hypothetical protein
MNTNNSNTVIEFAENEVTEMGIDFLRKENNIQVQMYLDGDSDYNEEYHLWVIAQIEEVRCPDCGGMGNATGMGGDSGYEGPCHGGPYANWV